MKSSFISNKDRNDASSFESARITITSFDAPPSIFANQTFFKYGRMFESKMSFILNRVAEPDDGNFEDVVLPP